MLRGLIMLDTESPPSGNSHISPPSDTSDTYDTISVEPAKPPT